MPIVKSVRDERLHTIDHQLLDGAARRLQLQSELFLKRREDRRRVGIGRSECAVGAARPQRGVGHEFEIRVVEPGESGFVDDDAADGAGEILASSSIGILRADMNPLPKIVGHPGAPGGGERGPPLRPEAAVAASCRRHGHRRAIGAGRRSFSPSRPSLRARTIS